MYLADVFIASCSQVLLKKAAEKPKQSLLKEYLDPVVIIAYGLFFLSTVLNTLAYRYLPMSLGPVLEATGYLYVTAFGVYIFHEKLTPRRVAGLALILTGILVYTLIG